MLYVCFLYVRNFQRYVLTMLKLHSLKNELPLDIKFLVPCCNHVHNFESNYVQIMFAA